MPTWLLPLLAFCAIAGFIGFAFRQGTKVKPDKDNNPDLWTRPSGGGGGDGSDGHS